MISIHPNTTNVSIHPSGNRVSIRLGGARGAPGQPGEQGAPGKSAYQSAVDGGFVGTESEWLASLKGSDGEDGQPGTPGNDGQDGSDGADGQAATITIGTVESGPPGSDAAVLNTGTPTAAVFNFTIPRGANGTPGANGAPGSPGANGQDAREVTIFSNGTDIVYQYVGDDNQHAIVSLAEITGPAGTNGTNGTNGADGTDGANGADGSNGREIELINDGANIVWRYVGDTGGNIVVSLSSLIGPQGLDGQKGDKGDKGDPGTVPTNVPQVIFSSVAILQDTGDDPPDTPGLVLRQFFPASLATSGGRIVWDLTGYLQYEDDASLLLQCNGVGLMTLMRSNGYWGGDFHLCVEMFVNASDGRLFTSVYAKKKPTIGSFGDPTSPKFASVDLSSGGAFDIMLGGYGSTVIVYANTMTYFPGV